MLNYRPIDIRKDKKILLEMQCRINFECESPYFRDKSYEKYRKKWMSTEQTKVFLSRLKKSLKNERTIARIVEVDSSDYRNIILSDTRNHWRLPRGCLWQQRNDCVGLHRYVVGYFWAQFFDIIGYNESYAEISELAVIPKYQRKGIATKMIKYIENEVKKLSIKMLRSGTGILNFPSLQLHRKLGYKPIRISYEKILE